MIFCFRISCDCRTDGLNILIPPDYLPYFSLQCPNHPNVLSTSTHHSSLQYTDHFNMKSTYQSIMVLLISTFFFVVRGHNKCVDLTIPVTVTAESLTTAFAPFQNSWESTAFIDRTVARVGTSSPLSGTKTVTDTFSISGQYCTPTGYAAKKNTLQILTHGLGFDKR